MPPRQESSKRNRHALKRMAFSGDIVDNSRVFGVHIDPKTPDAKKAAFLGDMRHLMNLEL